VDQAQEPTFSKPVTELLQLCEFGLGLLQDGNVGIGVFPERQDVLKSGVVFTGASLAGLEIFQGVLHQNSRQIVFFPGASAIRSHH